MAQNVAKDIPDGAYVNLGIGIPEIVAGYIPEDREVIYHTENGLLGMGKPAEKPSKSITHTCGLLKIARLSRHVW